MRLAKDARACAAKCADVLADRHLVVVEDDRHVRLGDVAAVVQRLERHAGGHRAVADHGDDLTRWSPLRYAAITTCRARRRSTSRVADAEGVVFISSRFGNGHAVLLLDRDAVAAASQDLVWIALVAVPDQPVLGRLVE